MRNQTLIFFFACTLFTACERKTKSKTETVVTTTPIQDSSSYFWNQLEAAGRSLRSPVQKYVVKGNTVKTITARNGLRVKVDPAVLQTISGKEVTEDIEVSIIEVVNQHDVMSYDVPTVSGDRILETGGSYYIAMSSGNEELEIREGKNMIIEMPQRSVRKMELFYGEEDSAGNFNWVPAGSTIDMKEVTTTNTNDSILTWRTSVTKEANRYIKESDFILLYADSVMRARLDSICMNHASISREQELKIMYKPIIIRKGRVYGAEERIEQAIMIRPDYRRLNIPKSTVVQDSVFVYHSRPEYVKANENTDLSDQDILYYEPTEISKMGWINCDRFINPPGQMIPISLNFDPAEKIRVCKAYYIFKNINSCIRDQFIGSGEQFIFYRKTTGLPQGAVVTVKLMAIVNGKLRVVQQEIVVGKDVSINIRFSGTT